MDNKQMFLIWGSGSIPSWRVMMVLAEKGLLEGLPGKMVSFDKMEHKGEDVLKMNPRGQVPTFKDGNTVISESGAVCFYLENNYSNEKNRLIPTDKSAQGIMYQRMFECSNVMSKVIEAIVYVRLFHTKQKEQWNQDKFEAARAELKLWNDYLEGADYLAGSSFSLADVTFFPVVAILVRLGTKFEKFKNLKRYYHNISKRQSVQESWPPHWKETDSPNAMEDFVA